MGAGYRPTWNSASGLPTGGRAKFLADVAIVALLLPPIEVNPYLPPYFLFKKNFETKESRKSFVAQFPKKS